jgi:hypothetical protein
MRGEAAHGVGLADPAEPSVTAAAIAAQVRAAVGHRAPLEVKVGMRAVAMRRAESEGQLQITGGGCR